MPRYQVELDGFPTEVVEAANPEAAWDAYKVRGTQGERRRTRHGKAPVVTLVAEEPEPVES